MKTKFYNYLLAIGKTHNTAYSYKNAIDLLSQNYSQNIAQEVYIYNIEDQQKISEISLQYSLNGQYSAIGQNGNGTWRNAIARYSEFFAGVSNNLNLESLILPEVHIESEVEQQQINFGYERDLQRTLCSQISDLFPNYRIYGSHNEGIEFAVNNRRIDVLLEHIENKDLLVVELKSGDADYKVFGQISMYIGLVQEKFPEKKVSGVIISGTINQSLQQACSTSSRIQTKVYRMKLELEDV